MAAMRKPLAGVPEEAHVPIQVPLPHSDVPKGLRGGISSFTVLREPPAVVAAEIVFSAPLVPLSLKGGSSLFTPLREPPAAPPPDLTFSPVPKAPLVLSGGGNFWSEFHEEPPPPPPVEGIFSPLIPTPRAPRLKVPPLQGSFEVTRVFPVKAQIRRGIYHRDGIYEAGFDFAVDEPFAAATANVQTIPDSVFTVVNFTSVASQTGFASVGSNLNQWNLINLVGEKIVFLHDGYYIVSVSGNWASNATGARRARVTYFTPTGVASRVVLEDVRPPISISAFAITSIVEAFQRNGWLVLEVFQSSGGPLDFAGAWGLSVHRISKPSRVFQ